MSVKKLWFIDKYGYPVECVKGHKLICFIRKLIHTRKLKYGESYV